MPPMVPVILPEDFYLPRLSRCGFEIRDVMPWDDALAYVTDGARFGVQFRDGEVRWLLQARGAGSLAGEYRLARESLPPSLRVEAGPGEIVREIWRANARTLAEMGGREGSMPTA